MKIKKHARVQLICTGIMAYVLIAPMVLHHSLGPQPQLLACAWPTSMEVAQAARALFVIMAAPLLPRLQHQLPLLLVTAHAVPARTEMALHAQAVPLVLPRLEVVTVPRQLLKVVACAMRIFTEMPGPARPGAHHVLMAALLLPRLLPQAKQQPTAHALPTGTEMVLRALNAILMWCVLLL